MGFNVKAALLVSLAFIGGMAWLIHHVGAPVAALPSPIAATEPPAAPAIPTAPPARTSALEYHSPLDRQDAQNRAQHDALVLSKPSNQPAYLPPLVLPPLEPAAGAADPEPPPAAPLAAAPANDRPAPDDQPLQPERGTAVTAAPPPAAAARTPERTGASPGGGSTVALPPPTIPAAKTYVVQRGDSVARIVRNHWNSDDPRLIRAFVEANPKIRTRQNRILIGEELVIPDLAATRLAATDLPANRGPAPARPAEAAPAAPPPTRATEQPRPRRELPPDPRRDKPQAPPIARAEQSAPRLAQVEPEAMRLVEPRPLPAQDPRSQPAARPGAPTRPVDASPAASTPNRPPHAEPNSVKKITGPMAKKLADAQTAPPRWYTIQPNDSLRSIARRYLKDERRWREIAALNPALRDADRLAPGTRIKLPPAVSVASR